MGLLIPFLGIAALAITLGLWQRDSAEERRAKLKERIKPSPEVTKPMAVTGQATAARTGGPTAADIELELLIKDRLQALRKQKELRAKESALATQLGSLQHRFSTTKPDSVHFGPLARELKNAAEELNEVRALLSDLRCALERSEWIVKLLADEQ